MNPSSTGRAVRAARRFDPPVTAALPRAHLGLRWRALTSEDVDDLAALWQRSAAADAPIQPLGVDELTEVLHDARTTGDTLGGFDQDGILRAAAALVLETDGEDGQVRLTATVDPGTRGRGIGKALMTWQDDRARQILAEAAPRGAARILVEVDAHHTDRRRLCAAAGLSPLRGDGPRTTFAVSL